MQLIRQTLIENETMSWPSVYQQGHTIHDNGAKISIKLQGSVRCGQRLTNELARCLGMSLLIGWCCDL